MPSASYAALWSTGDSECRTGSRSTRQRALRPRSSTSSTSSKRAVRLAQRDVRVLLLERRGERGVTLLSITT